MIGRRTLIGIVVGTAAVGCGVAMAVWQPWQAMVPAGASAPLRTVPVERTTLSADLVLSAQLEYAAPTTLIGNGGTLTRLPHAGDVITAGQAVYEVDGQDVVMFTGDRPLWRPLASGVDDGPDIHEVEQNLADQGYGEGLTVDDAFTSATDRAIRQWQKDHGRQPTGTLDPADVAIVAGTSIRVNTVTADLGAAAAGPILSYTDPTIRGRITLSAAQLTQLAPGIGASVRLPNGSQTPVTVASVDPGGTASGDSAKPTPPSAEIDFPDQTVLHGIGLPAVRVTVGTGTAAEALVVPVTALVAQAPDGYAVEVPTTNGTRLVPVTIGLIADSRAQIVGGAIAEGDLVVVPG
jgi:peptidoglycan hydrolase-like protein with peptidoglycan-binding domain